MIKKLAFALSVTTICTNIQPAHGFQKNNLLELDRARISVKKVTPKRVVRGQTAEDRKRNILFKRNARAERLKMSRVQKASRVAKRVNRTHIQNNALIPKLRSSHWLRVVKKENERFENRLVRRGLKKSVHQAMELKMRSMLSDVRNELKNFQLIGQNILAQLTEGQSKTNSQPPMALQNVETRTVVMDESQQLPGSPAIKAVKLVEESQQLPASPAIKAVKLVEESSPMIHPIVTESMGKAEGTVDGYPAQKGDVAPSSHAVRFSGKLMVPPATLLEQSEGRKQAKLSSTILEAKTFGDLSHGLVYLASLGDQLLLSKDNYMNTLAATNVARARAFMEGKEKIDAVGDVKTEMHLLSKSIAAHPEEAQAAENSPNIFTFVKAWVTQVLKLNNS